MEESGTHKIRPAGRHLLTIGRDLIQNQYAAVVELVKNAYDADSPDVIVSFLLPEDENPLEITILDHGHGMSRDTVINSWLVPSTDDKKRRKTSPEGRIMQGRKGIGRYAASILGNNLLLETATNEGEETTVYVEWKDFEDADFLDDVDILVETKKTDKPSYTKLTIIGDREHLKEWDEKQIRKLKFELKKLIPPVQDNMNRSSFDIFLKFDPLWENAYTLEQEKIEPYPIFDLFDYKVSGQIDAGGNGSLIFINQKAKNTIKEGIGINFEEETGCGELYFDIRVYDREPQAIEQLITRGLKDSKGNYVGKMEARQLLNEYNGIGVYRNGFRIRPMGDPDFDWLKLNEQRVQNPSLRIGSNQAIGYVLIQSEELSALEEKSARDGLRENYAYSRLKKLTLTVIGELEKRRFDYRRRAGLSRITLKVEKELEKLFSFDKVKEGIRKKLSKSGIDRKVTDEIISILTKDEEAKNKIADDIKQVVAVYQGQATLGKIINVILHEGRRPLNYFKNQIPNFSFWAEEFKKKQEKEILDDLIPITEGIERNAKTFVNLFGRLDPLASAKRGEEKHFKLKHTVEDSFKVFEQELLDRGISYKIEGPVDLEFQGWPQDIYVIMTNLIDNSIFWIHDKNVTTRKIHIEIVSEGDKLSYLDYHDTGPGIEKYLIESEVIFEPEFSTKPGGTGLGLAIAGEAAFRNGLELKAFEFEDGAYFRLQPVIEEQ